WQLNFHNDNVSWSTINKEINDIPWHTLFNGKNTDTCIKILLSCLLMLCIKLIPRKKPRSKSKIPRERKKLLNRMKMLKREKHRTYSKLKEKMLEKKIHETETMLIHHRKEERRTKEKKVIENMKNNPKVLFDYINKQKIEIQKLAHSKYKMNIFMTKKKFVNCW
ncbi:unnamed protein product, partial [Meganyctiphanes norvegica]